MGYSLWHENGRDIGYGVPARCDQPGCNAKIDRGMSYRCWDIHGEHGCGLFFCSKHRYFHSFRDGECCEVCKRCDTYRPPYDMKPDAPEWIRWKLKDPSWQEWRENHPKEVEKMHLQIKQLTKKPIWK